MRLQLSRQMWDECRHAAAQWRILERIGGHLGMFPAVAYINEFVGDEPDVLKRLIVLQRVVEGTAVDLHRPRARYFRAHGADLIVQMLDYVLADEDTHIALSRWIPRLIGDEPDRRRELEAYQARKERETADYMDWIVARRRDLARSYPASPARAASAPGRP